MQVAITAAGFTPGEADVLRRAMGHKRSRERMAAICEQLIDGHDEATASPRTSRRRIYNQINAFADYGFPESHAASFALIVYASAYLRHYYAPEFLGGDAQRAADGVLLGRHADRGRAPAWREGSPDRSHCFGLGSFTRTGGRADVVPSGWSREPRPERQERQSATRRPPSHESRATSHRCARRPARLATGAWTRRPPRGKNSSARSSMARSPTSPTSSGDRASTRAPCARYAKQARSTAWWLTIRLTSAAASRCGGRWMPCAASRAACAARRARPRPVPASPQSRAHGPRPATAQSLPANVPPRDHRRRLPHDRPLAQRPPHAPPAKAPLA